jgi:hypothetical protein
MFENKDVQQLTEQVRQLVSINSALLKKLEQQQSVLLSIAAFVSKNSETCPSFGVL